MTPSKRTPTIVTRKSMVFMFMVSFWYAGINSKQGEQYNPFFRKNPITRKILLFPEMKLEFLNREVVLSGSKQSPLAFAFIIAFPLVVESKALC